MARDRERHVPSMVPSRGRLAAACQRVRAARHGAGPPPCAAGAAHREGHAAAAARYQGAGRRDKLRVRQYSIDAFDSHRRQEQIG
eukprot:6189257-Pleurochrysis_carterae.AAC.5